MLCCLLAIWLAAAAGFTVLLSYMTNDYQKTMVEHDYGTAGYLVNHPDTNVAAAFTKDKTDSDLEAGSIPPPGSQVVFFAFFWPFFSQSGFTSGNKTKR